MGWVRKGLVSHGNGQCVQAVLLTLRGDGLGLVMAEGPFV